MASSIRTSAQAEVFSGGDRDILGEVAVAQGVIWRLKLQRLLGHLFLLPMGAFMIFLIRCKFGLKIEDHQRLRREFREIAKSGAPLLICANHLTLVDSIVILWALASIPKYFVSYRSFGWNIPAIENYCRKPTWRLITYLNKCIPIDRSGSRAHIDSVLAKLSYLLSSGDVCIIFPEGTRSRTGRVNVEGAGYGIGRLIRRTPGCRVLCFYQRGLGQESFSDFPKKGERFHIEMEVLTPHSSSSGLRAVKDYSVQVISKLKEMEDRHFHAHSRLEHR